MPILAILRRDINRYRRNPIRTALLFALPLVMAAIFALVFGGGGTDAISIRVLLWDEDDSLLSRVARSIGDTPQSEQRLEIVPVGEEGLAMMDRGEASALVHLPAGFTRSFLVGEVATIEVVKNPAERFLPQVVEEGVGLGGAVLSTASTVLRPELAAIGILMETEGFPPSAAIGGLASGINNRLQTFEEYLFPPAITLETVELAAPVEGVKPQSSILAYFLPGLAVMGVLFLAQSATRDILRDRESGLLRHLLTAPVSAGEYLVGKCLSVLLITTIGFAVLIGIGVSAGVSWGPPGAVLLLVLATAIGCSGTLLLIMSLVGTERQGDALTTIVIISWSMLGGAFVPLEQMPIFIRPLSASTLVFWAIDAFNSLILHNGGISDIVVNVAILIGAGTIFLVAGALLLGHKIRRGTL